MPDIWGQTLTPLGVNQTAIHLSRQAEVIFIKKMRNIPVAGLDGDAESVEGLIKFDEFIHNSLMVENTALENRDGYITTGNVSVDHVGRGLPLGSGVYALRNLYFQITAGASINTPIDPGSGISLIPNQDVSIISVDSTTAGPSSASITIRNPQNKYVHKRHPMYIGRSVFESEDIVYVNLPGLDGQLYRTFTGFVTSVSVGSMTEGGTLQNFIVIECEDMMKRLRETRTNVKPGFIPAEARRNVSPYNISFAGKLAHEILAEVCAYAYCDFESIPEVYDQLADFRKDAVKDANTAASNEFALLDQYTKLPIGTTANVSGPLFAQTSANPAPLGLLPNTPAPPSASIAAISTAYRLAGRQEGASTNAFFITTGTLTTQAVQNVQVNSQTAPGAAITPTTVTLSTSIPKQVFGFKSASNSSSVQNDTLAQAVNQAVPVKGVVNQFPIDDLAFVLEGTSQPAYSITFSAFGLDQFVSEWQSALEVARTIADTIGFELFTTPEGVLWFRPLNVFLPADVPPGTTTEKVTGNQKPRVGTEYWLNHNFIKRESYTETDRDIFTVCITMGYWEWQSLNTGLENFRPGIVVDSLRFQKYGARYAPRQSRLELTDKSATEAWSRAYLNRINAKASRGHVEYMGDARLRAGNPCYIPHRNRIYYIESIHHEFVAGKTYTMSLGLVNGRSPVAVSTFTAASNMAVTIAGSNPSLANDLTTRYLFPNPIKRMSPTSNLGAIENSDPLTGLSPTGPSESQRYLDYGSSATPSTISVATPSTLPFSVSPSPLSLSPFSGTSSLTVTGGGNGQLVFNGFVWEDLQIMTYEDMLPDMTTSQPTIYLSQLLLDQRLNSRSVRSLLQNYSQKNPTQAIPSLQNNLLSNWSKLVAATGAQPNQLQSQLGVSTPLVPA